LKISSLKKSKIILSDGQTPNNGGAINVTSSPHSLLLYNVIIMNNSSQGSGGGVYTLGSVMAVRSLIKLNAANIQGGGLWSIQGVTLIKSRVINNTIRVADPSNGGVGIYVDDPSNGGVGIYVDDGDCIIDKSQVSQNKVNYDLEKSTGGSGGGVVVIRGSLYVQNNSHVDNNSAYNSGGIPS
jgi:hypothetical protein